MRRVLHCLLIVVLIVRGLAGTAMAAGLLSPVSPAAGAHLPLAHVEHIEHGVQHAPDAGHASESPLELPAHLHTGQPPTTSPAANACHEGPANAGVPHHQSHSAACSACDICHSAMLDVAAPDIPTPALSGVLQPCASAHFASAPAALAVKPPIA